MSNQRAVRLEWTGEGLRFSGRGTEPPSPSVVIDGDAVGGPSPMLALLLALAACAASDVVVILRKMKVELATLAVDVRGTRREEHPRRYVAIRFRFRMGGGGLDRSKAERAVSLSLEKYCSVVHTIASDVEVGFDLDLV